jgi:hypothetical protein
MILGFSLDSTPTAGTTDGTCGGLSEGHFHLLSKKQIATMRQSR